MQHHINKLADSCGAPRFPPPVTLLGGVTGRMQAEVAELAQQLASSLEVRGTRASSFSVPLVQGAQLGAG